MCRRPAAFPSSFPPPRRGLQAATVVGVSTFETRWFKTLTLEVQTEGEELVIFGSREKLHQILVSLGYQGEERSLIPGLPLDLPCEIETVADPSHFYRFIDRILPIR